jgi:probable rRNA maturation factor
MWQSRPFEIIHAGRPVGTLEVQLVQGIAWPDAPETIASAIRAAVPHLVALHTMPSRWSVTFRLGDPTAGAQLNRDFRGKNYVPDVLSFPADDDDAQTDGADDFYLGDVFITAEKCQVDAAAQNKPATEHLAHLTVHGLLHLLGHDHELGPAEEATMRALEIQILADMGIANPYEGDPVA